MTSRLYVRARLFSFLKAASYRSGFRRASTSEGRRSSGDQWTTNGPGEKPYTFRFASVAPNLGCVAAIARIVWLSIRMGPFEFDRLIPTLDSPTPGSGPMSAFWHASFPLHIV